MKTKLILLFTVLSLSVSGIIAQDRRQMNPEDMAKRQSETLTERLKLNNEQKEKVYEISLKYSKERSAQMNSDTDRDKRREKMQEAQKKQDEELKAIFTDEQKKEYDKYNKERESQRGQRGGGRRR